MKRLRFVVVALMMVMVFAWKFAPGVKAQSSTNLSAYEFLLGSPCTIDGEAGKCGVSFGGWMGGGGPVAGGWTPFPGNRQGLWDAEINYTGSPDFNGSVTVRSGTFDLYFKGGKTLSGTVTGGTVSWPTSSSDNEYGCGDGVAQVTVQVTTGSSLTFKGCLHDLPAGSVIPPKIWGTLGPPSSPCVESGPAKPNC